MEVEIKNITEVKGAVYGGLCVSLLNEERYFCDYITFDHENGTAKLIDYE
jgi:hypothetical protein